jgi:hypothetical protein
MPQDFVQKPNFWKNPKGSINTYVVSWRWTQGSFIEIHYSVESIAW